jgi:hypothetical protein
VQTKFDRRKLGEKGWRKAGAGNKYRNKESGFHRVTFVWSTVICKLIKEGEFKIMPSLKNPGYGRMPPTSDELGRRKKMHVLVLGMGAMGTRCNGAGASNGTTTCKTREL